MLPSSPAPIRARFEHREANERDAARPLRRPAMASPVLMAGRIAVALLEVEAGYRPGHQLERWCHPTLWERLAPRLCFGGGPAITCRSLRRVLVQEHIPGLVDAVAVLERGRRVEPVAMRLDAAPGLWEVIEMQYLPATGPAAPHLPPPFRAGCQPAAVLPRTARPSEPLRSPSSGVPQSSAARSPVRLLSSGVTESAIYGA
jgi:Family of unknown function (DUF6459)